MERDRRGVTETEDGTQRWIGTGLRFGSTVTEEGRVEEMEEIKQRAGEQWVSGSSRK